MAGKCSEKTFQMICNGRGFWQGFQKCVKKMCVVNETLYSKLVPVGSTHSPSCPKGFEIAEAEKSSLCQGKCCQKKFSVIPFCNKYTRILTFEIFFVRQKKDNCLMSSVKTCRELECNYNSSSGDSRVVGPARDRLGGNISVRCAEDFITFQGSATYTQDFVATCQADGCVTVFITAVPIV